METEEQLEKKKCPQTQFSTRGVTQFLAWRCCGYTTYLRDRCVLAYPHPHTAVTFYGLETIAMMISEKSIIQQISIPSKLFDVTFSNNAIKIGESPNKLCAEYKNNKLNYK